MPLLDWLRGRSAGTPPEVDAPEREKVEARRHAQEASSTPPEQPETTEGAIEDRRHEEPPRDSAT